MSKSPSASLWGRVTDVALASNKLKRMIMPRDHQVDLLKIKPEERYLRTGDSISLFSIEGIGYLGSEGYNLIYFFLYKGVFNLLLVLFQIHR